MGNRMTNEDLKKDIRRWAVSKGILTEGTISGQITKLVEEASEVQDAFDNSYLTHVLTELGDVLVVAEILAHLLGSDTHECMSLAHAKNSKRSGKMENGVFVKD